VSARRHQCRALIKWRCCVCQVSGHGRFRAKAVIIIIYSFANDLHFLWHSAIVLYWTGKHIKPRSNVPRHTKLPRSDSEKWGPMPVLAFWTRIYIVFSVLNAHSTVRGNAVYLCVCQSSNKARTTSAQYVAHSGYNIGLVHWWWTVDLSVISRQAAENSQGGKSSNSGHPGGPSSLLRLGGPPTSPSPWCQT